MSEWKPAEWKNAVPLDYLHEKRQIGRVYAAVQKGPPLEVKEYEGGIDDHPDCIVIEFEDLMSLGAKDLGLPGKTEDVLRIALQFSGARKLCCQLIYGLADAGDRVATKIQESMQEAMDSVAEEDE